MRMLLVEDEASLLRAIKGYLNSEGVNVDAADNGIDAQFYLDTYEYDAILLDIMLPGIDGLTLLTRYRKRGGTAPVLMITARDAIDDRVTGLDRGADDYLTKPFALEEMMARLRALTRRVAGSAVNELIAGGVRMDCKARRVYANDEPIELSAREYDILHTLMLNTGVVLTRAQIEDNVWRSDIEIGSNIVDAYVRLLRKKLGSASPIETVRGVGYVVRKEP